MQRDPELRIHYLTPALADVRRLLGAIDRNPYRPTYGCLDRGYWHYRTSSFPSEMFQEGALALALVYAHALPGNRWHQDPAVRELAVAALRFSARSSHPDGSCDDYYPWERALGAAVFSLQAEVRAYQTLGLNDSKLAAFFERRARWIAGHEESGRLTNHHALAALGLLGVGQITGKAEFLEAAARRIDRVLQWQDPEGWFDEYGGADPGYQTVTIDCLAKYARATGDARLAEPLARAVRFVRFFLHPDGSLGGEYGSRGTCHFYAHGFELLAGENAAAADMADAALRSIASGSCAAFDDDRLFAHRTANWIEAHLDWSPDRAEAQPRKATEPAVEIFPSAGLMACRLDDVFVAASAARGNTFRAYRRDDDAETWKSTADAGLIVATTDGGIAVSQMHSRDRTVAFHDPMPNENGPTVMTSAGPLHWVRFETLTPLKQIVFYGGLWLIGRWCRTAVRRLLQRRTITGRRQSPIVLKRTIEIWADERPQKAARFRVTDEIELRHPSMRVRRMGFGVGFESAYVAASGVYQKAMVAPWQDLADQVDVLNRDRKITVVREW